MWSHGGRGPGGKRFKTFDLIHHYWDLIEGDFAKYLHCDARDFIRGTRPWDQFLNYCDTIAQEVGGRFWAAQLNDPRYLPDIKKRYAEQQREPGNGRPPLEGHTEVVKAIYLVANQIRLLIKATTQSEIEFIEGPEGPVDRINAEAKAASLALVDQALGYQEVS